MIPKDRPIVVALGGNAISPAHAEGNIPQQFDAARQTAVVLAELIADGYRVVITHGNGPQVGNVLRRVELAAHEVYPLPLDICVADTQAGMGYVIAQCLNNELRRRGVGRMACTLVTCVEVDAGDLAFANPTKPIGRFYPRERAVEMRERYGWQMVEVTCPSSDRSDQGRELPDQSRDREGAVGVHGERVVGPTRSSSNNGSSMWRRVVPSPQPKRIIEIETIRRLVAAGELLVVAGGGGIPVVRDASGGLKGIEAVIDKDMTAALLARELGDHLLVIVTAEPRVAIRYGTPDVKWIDRMTTAEASRWLAEAHFPPGSMGPKIEAAIAYLSDNPDPAASVVICDNATLREALAGRAGTWIEP